ncbi:general transcription factor II-I repeat domain-containing protein 2-like [Tachypleus tridentatus]|uniref:general transcription factor II-I repeat domain-containing protein 2-like n=1 Tax=Tachypleus tridentatus TaxID=6853 RepID=UPI003FD168C5
MSCVLKKPISLKVSAFQQLQLYGEQKNLERTSHYRYAKKLGTSYGILLHWMSLLISQLLLVFIRGVNLDFQITEELASVCSTHGRTSGEDIFMEVHKTLQDYNLQWNQLRGVTVDGGKNMAGVKKGLVELIRKQLEDLQLPSALFIHCIMHQQALYGKDLDISCILKPVISAVNFIRGHALNHRQFKAFLEEIDKPTDRIDKCSRPVKV